MSTTEAKTSILSADWREAIRRIRSQLAILGLLLSVYLLSALGIVPSIPRLYEILAGFFEKYGTLVLAPISFVENLVGLNVYFPGSVAILTSMALSAGDLQRAIQTFFAIILPAFMAHQINYLIGRRMRRDDSGNGRYDSASMANLIFIGALWHPHFAALTCIDAGAQGMSYRRFLSVFTPWFIAWNVFWGVAMYTFGSKMTQDARGSNSLLLSFLFLWLIWDLFNLGVAFRLIKTKIAARLATRS